MAPTREGTLRNAFWRYTQAPIADGQLTSPLRCSALAVATAVAPLATIAFDESNRSQDVKPRGRGSPSLGACAGALRLSRLPAQVRLEGQARIEVVLD